MVKIIWILGSEIIHKKKQYRMAIADLIPCVLFICLFVVVVVFDCFCPSSQGVKDLKKLTRYFSELLLPMCKYFTLLRMLQMRTRIPASQRTYISRHPYQDRSCWSMWGVCCWKVLIRKKQYKYRTSCKVIWFVICMFFCLFVFVCVCLLLLFSFWRPSFIKTAYYLENEGSNTSLQTTFSQASETVKSKRGVGRHCGKNK